MAKFDEREGNSCHIHISLRGVPDGEPSVAVFADETDPLGMSPMFRSFIAGQLATMRELTLFYAPNINSYKRFVEGSFAPTAVAGDWTTAPARCGWSAAVTPCGWSCARPGGDVNQYLAVAALVAGGLHGIDQGSNSRRPARATPTPRVRNTFRPRWPRPPSCSTTPRWHGRRSATRWWTTILNNARVELAAFNSAVTDWERVRGFERL